MRLVERIGRWRASQRGERYGDWLQCHSGGRFWVLDPRPADVDIADIAWGLSHLCRFSGQCNWLHSVASHCLLVSDIVPSQYALEGLLHDAAEAYLQDMVRPLKIHLPQYYEVEARVERVIAQRFGLEYPWPREIKRADRQVLCTERRDLFDHDLSGWHDLVVPLGPRIEYVEPAEVRRRFLRRFTELYSARRRLRVA